MKIVKCCLPHYRVPNINLNKNFKCYSYSGKTNGKERVVLAFRYDGLENLLVQPEIVNKK